MAYAATQWHDDIEARVAAESISVSRALLQPMSVLMSEDPVTNQVI